MEKPEESSTTISFTVNGKLYRGTFTKYTISICNKTAVNELITGYEFSRVALPKTRLHYTRGPSENPVALG